MISLRGDHFILDVRECLTWREFSIADDRYIYITLYADEADERCDRFREEVIRPNALAANALELTDAVVHVATGGVLCVIRGGACTFPLYWNALGGRLRISTCLPIGSGEPISRRGLVAALSATFIQSSYELNTIALTPLADWRRCRRGAVTRFRSGNLEEDVPVLHTPVNGIGNKGPIGPGIREAFHSYNRALRLPRTTLLELSGGFDSTLAAAAAPAVLGAMHGASVIYPYYEFRFEDAVQEAVGKALGIPRVVLDGLDEFPYTPPTEWPRMDEPTVFATGYRHAERIALLAAELNAERLIVGHGGDQLFATDLFAQEPVSNLPDRRPFNAPAWKDLHSAYHTTIRSPWLQRCTGCFVYDARIDMWMKERFGITVRTPFTDRALFQSALQWSAYCSMKSMRPDKRILCEAVPDLLPDAVVQRKGKVAYDGVWMRAYAANAEHLARTFAQTAGLLEHIGFSPGWLEKRVAQLASWREVSSQEVLAAYALSTWWLSWGMERPGDVAWSMA